jgi:hypothetical protein
MAQSPKPPQTPENNTRQQLQRTTVKNDVKERLEDRIRPQYLACTTVHSNTSEHSTLLLTGNNAKEPPLSVTTVHVDTAIRQNLGRTFWSLATEYMRENDTRRRKGTTLREMTPREEGDI